MRHSTCIEVTPQNCTRSFTWEEDLHIYFQNILDSKGITMMMMIVKTHAAGSVPVCVPLRGQEAEEPIGGGPSPEQMLPMQSHSARMCTESVRLLIRIWAKEHGFSRAPCKG